MKWLRERIILWAMSREPDECIGDGKGNTYMRRHHVVRLYGWLNIYVHQFLCSDDERGKHDHPWWSWSWMLSGWMHELFGENESRLIVEGDFIFRDANHKHRLLVAPKASGHIWTLFITGPKTKEWGFYLADGWTHWKQIHKDRLANDYAERERS